METEITFARIERVRDRLEESDADSRTMVVQLAANDVRALLGAYDDAVARAAELEKEAKQ